MAQKDNIMLHNIGRAIDTVLGRRYIIRSTDPYEYREKDFGKIGGSFKNIKQHQEGYAEIFSEGCRSLEKLLSHLWEHDIETLACCAGHKSTFYEKRTLLGRKKVDEAEFMKHKNTAKIYSVEEFSSPYIMFKCAGEYKAVAQDIKKNLEKQGLPYGIKVGWDSSERISIYQDHFWDMETSNQFFEAVQVALDQVLGIENKYVKKEISKEEPKKEIRKLGLDEKIQKASERINDAMVESASTRAALTKTTIDSHPKEHKHFEKD